VGRILTHFYLPYSQICAISAPIPFYLKLSSTSEQSLKPFAGFSPALPSFLPFSASDTTLSTTSLPALPHQLMRVPPPSATPSVSVMLVRQILADATGTGVCIVGARGGMVKDIVIGEGVLHRVTKTQDSLTWAGEIRICPKVQCSGFHSPGLVVRDAIILSIKPPDPAHSPLTELRRAIPVRLTTHPYECHTAAKVSDL